MWDLGGWLDVVVTGWEDVIVVKEIAYGRTEDKVIWCVSI